MPEITVLTVTRRANLVPRFIESIAAQDFEGGVRHVVVVDGDPRVCQALSDEGSRYPPEVIFASRSDGDGDGPARLAVLRNRAPRAARTGLVAFHDDDNTWEADHLSSLWQTRIAAGADIVHSERKVFEANGDPYLRPEFPWGRDALTRRAIYAYCLEAGIMERASNVMHDRLEMRFTWIDLGEWIFPAEFLHEYQFQTAYTAWDWYNISVEDRELPRASGYHDEMGSVGVCAFATRGLEDIAAAEIGELPVVAGDIEIRPKAVLTRASDVRGLRGLRTVDDVAVVGASAASVDDLPALVALVAEADLEKTIEQAQRADRLDGTFSLTVSAAYAPYGSSGVIEQAVVEAVSGRYHWQYTELQRAPIDIRVFVDGPWALIGVRAFDEPLSRRAYRVVNVRGALRPTVAAALVRIAGTGAGRLRVWDPFCGSATILCEAAQRSYEVWGTDLDPEAVEASRENLAAVNREYWNRIECADSTSPKTWKKHQSATAVVSNLPWGKQVAIKSKQALYDSVSGGTAELVRRGGTSVLLTTEPKLIQQRLKRDTAVHVEERRIGLLGQTPTILVARPAK